MAIRPLSDLNIKFEKTFFAPRFWPTWLLMGLIGLSASLPRPLANKIGDGLGWCFKKLNKKREQIVATNLQLCFPQHTAAQRAELAAAHYRFYGRSVVDLGLTWWASMPRLERLIQFKGEAAYLQTLKTHNVILLLPHFTALDCAAGFAATLHPAISMMKVQKNALLNWRLWKGRTRYQAARVIMREQGLRPLIKAAKNRVVCFYMPDEDFGDSSLTVYAPFFGRPISTLITLARMAKLTDAKVVPLLPTMLENGHYVVEFKPPLANFPSGDDLQDATAVNQVIEQAINAAPAQYMWTLQWFRSQPNQAASPYKKP